MRDLPAAASDMVLIENTTSGLGSARIVLRKSSISPSSTQDPNWILNSNGTFRLSAGTDAAEFTLDAMGNATFAGSLTTNGPSCSSGCDRVYDPAFERESIEEHAASMWTSRHLPAVGSTEPGTPMDLSEKTGGILHELEMAHIYIEQLNDSIKQRDQVIQDLVSRIERLEASASR